MLSISDLSKTYRNGVQALNRVNLEIGPGMFGLLGPNGAGKSTLMRTIAALQAPDTGRVVFEGVDIVKHPQSVREKLGYLPQEFGVYPKISAFDLLEHLALLKGLHSKKERVEQVNALLEQTNLYKDRKKAVHSFSGGMRQRFGIAQALLGNPSLIIVDEPTAGLDPEERNRFHNLLSDLGQHMVVILSTHIVDDVRDLCSRMAVLCGGRVLLEGEPEALIREHRGFVWRKRCARQDVARLEQELMVLSVRLIAGKPVVHVYADEKPEEGFEQIDAGLEDVYFRVLKGEETCS